MNTHPEKWYIPLTEENYNEVKSWWLKQVEKSGWGRTHLPHDVLVLSEHPLDSSHYWSGPTGFSVRFPEYQEITLEQFREITNPHPEKWYIVATEENIEELNRWRLSVRTESAAMWDGRFKPGCYLLSEYPEDDDGSYFYIKTTEPFPSKFPEYQEITLEQFRQITNSTPTPMPKTIQISRQLLNEYYDAATGPQKEYLTEHFKLDGTTTDEAIRELHAMACDTWKPRIKKNHPDCFPEESKYFDFSSYVSHSCFNILKEGVGHQLGMSNNFIRIRSNPSNPETHKRSFYLDSDYDWELKLDGREISDPVYVLIPTKKLS